uniref:Uncharacterized protein n=1 Tax=Oryza sativa subsp. japonica TaxID=39947 RepID=Q6Z8E8_ORYSJ|nr:hypothetical protein [Oryza sativa Japonica Group]
MEVKNNAPADLPSHTPFLEDLQTEPFPSQIWRFSLLTPYSTADLATAYRGREERLGGGGGGPSAGGGGRWTRREEEGDGPTGRLPPSVPCAARTAPLTALPLRPAVPPTALPLQSALVIPVLSVLAVKKRERRGDRRYRREKGGE